MAPRVFRTPYGELYVRTWCMSRVPILVQHVHRCVRHEECGKLHAMCTGLPKLLRDPTSRAGCSHAAAIASKGVRRVSLRAGLAAPTPKTECERETMLRHPSLMF